MVEFVGKVTKKFNPKHYSSKYGDTIKFFMQLEDESGNLFKDDYGNDVKMMVQVEDFNAERTTVQIGDIVRVTCRRDSKKQGWCSVTLKQNFEILERNTCPVEIREVIGEVTGRGRAKLYSGSIPKMFMVVKDHSNGEEIKCMVRLDLEVDEYEGDLYGDDPNTKISKGDIVKFRCSNADFDESGWCNINTDCLTILDDSGQQDWVKQKS